MRPGTKKLLWLLAAFFAAWLSIRYILPLALPFLLGLALALGAEPMVRLLRRRLRLPRGAASAISVTFGFMLTALFALVVAALLVRELGSLAGILPDLEQAARSGVTTLEKWLLTISAHAPDSLEPLLRQNITAAFSDGSALLDKVVSYLLSLAGALLGHIPDSALGVGTAVISGYMISAKLPQLRRSLLSRIPREKLRAFLKAAKRIKATIFSFLLAQLKLSAVTLVLLCLGFVLLRVPHAPVWALGVALVDAFPVLGTGTVLLPWSLVSLLQGNTPRALGLLGVYTVVSVTRSVLEPRFLGKHLGLDPLLTLAAMYTGFKLWGIGGMLLAPILTVTAIQLLPQTKR